MKKFRTTALSAILCVTLVLLLFHVPAWTPNTLHSSMKYDGGIGVRALAKGVLVRIDAAMGNAGNYGVQMMVGQPFNF